MNQISINFILIALMFLLFSCNNTYYPGLKTNIFEGTGIENINALNAKYLIPNKVYTFKVRFKVNNKEYYAKANKIIKGKEKVSNFVSLASLNAKLKDEVFLQLYVIPENSNQTSLDNTQTLIGYKYINISKNQIIAWELTGILNTPKLIYVHPPRGLFFWPLEYCGFPEIRYDVPKWEGNLTIFSHNKNLQYFGELDSLLNCEGVKSEFEKFDNGEITKINVYSYNSRNNDLLSKGYFEFETNSGLKKMIYEFGKNKIELELVNTRNYDINTEI